eukprot:907723-Rhodomonas_salina.1
MPHDIASISLPMRPPFLAIWAMTTAALTTLARRDCSTSSSPSDSGSSSSLSDSSAHNSGSSSAP